MAILFVLALKKKKAIFIVPIVLVYILSFGVDYYLAGKGDSFVQNITSIVDKISSKKNSFYDKKGNAYENKEDLIFYDEQGTEYKFKDFEFDTVVCLSDKQEFESNQCYISGHGYFYFDENDRLKYNEDADYYYDGSGEVYYPIYKAVWNSNGYLINNAIENSQ